ncbi:MAG: YtxH domain-containing protein [Acidobacteria bacterium]|nr:YtxH domain-containing protein [Acidobacteriota bacterium]
MKSFITGLAVGCGLGLLLAPEAGSETRKGLIGRLKQAKDVVPESAKPLLSSVVQRFEEIVQPAGKQGAAAEAARLLEIFNTASKTKLMSVSGIGDATARRIIDGRPYNSSDAVAGSLSESVLQNLKKELLETDAA